MGLDKLKKIKANLKKSFDKKQDDVARYLSGCRVSKDLSGENYIVHPGNDGNKAFDALAEHDNVSIINVNKDDGSFCCFVCAKSAADKAFEAAYERSKAPAQAQETVVQATLESG